MSYTRRRISLATLLLSVSATVLATSVASAQVKTTKDTTKAAVSAKKPVVKHRAGAARSEVQVPVQKKVTQQGGEVAPPVVAQPIVPPPNQDSIDRANRLRDSLAAAAERERQEAAARAERDRLARIAAEERARRDSIAAAEEAARLLRERLGRYGFYWGLAAGPSLPASDFSQPYKLGFNITVPFGWDFRDSPLGIRADASYDLFDGKYIGNALMSNVQVYSLNADAKLRMKVPVFGYLDRFYLIGGAGAHRVVSNGGDDPTAITNGKSNNGFSTTFSGASTKFGWNAGAGMSFGFGRSALFLESRYFDHSTDNTYASSARFVPIILGLTF